MLLKGDLTTTALTSLLTELATESMSGCLHIIDTDGDEALVYVKAGLIYSVLAPGRRPSLGARLVSSGALAPEALAEALEAQRNELQGWRLGELLVHLGFVEQPVVEAFVVEQVRDSMSDLMRWTAGRWRFRKNEKAREDVAPAMPVNELLAEVAWRHTQWNDIAETVHGPAAVPVLSSRAPASADIMLDADAWSLLCKVDNERALAELARECGYTLYEAGQIVYRLVQAGLLDVEEDLAAEPSAAPIAYDIPVELTEVNAPVETVEVIEETAPDPYGSLGDITAAVASALSSPSQAPELPAEEEDEAPAGAIASRLISAFGGKPRTAEVPETPAEDDVVEDVVIEEPETHAVAGSAEDADLGELAKLITSVAYGNRDPQDELPREELDTSALIPIDLLNGPVPVIDRLMPDRAENYGDNPDDPFGQSIARVSEALSDLLGPQQADYDPFEQSARGPRKKSKKAEPEKPKLAPEEVARREKIRSAAAAELAAAHATAEAERRRAAGLPVEDELATVVDLQTVRAENERRENERLGIEEQTTRELAERAAAEEIGWSHHALWLKAERMSAEFDAHDEHEEWLAELADAVALAEVEAWAEHVERLAAELAAAADEAWAEYAVRLAAEVAAAETDAWADHAQWLNDLRASVEEQAWADHAQWLNDLRTS
ncbi:MAG: hypothetical protein QOE24_1020, partial [Frankiales bacterium]|nr:hypothetical protein [Frankiales bacterium]